MPGASPWDNKGYVSEKLCILPLTTEKCVSNGDIGHFTQTTVLFLLLRLFLIEIKRPLVLTHVSRGQILMNLYPTYVRI